MPKVTLTDRFIANAKAEKQIDYFDSKTTGLVLRVAGNGVRSWCLFYTAPNASSSSSWTLSADFARRCADRGDRGEGAPRSRH